eukprot:UN29660
MKLAKSLISEIDPDIEFTDDKNGTGFSFRCNDKLVDEIKDIIEKVGSIRPFDGLGTTPGGEFEPGNDVSIDDVDLQSDEFVNEFDSFVQLDDLEDVPHRGRSNSMISDVDTDIDILVAQERIINMDIDSVGRRSESMSELDENIDLLVEQERMINIDIDSIQGGSRASFSNLDMYLSNYPQGQFENKDTIHEDDEDVVDESEEEEVEET